jgi:predicted transcriptional regulator
VANPLKIATALSRIKGYKDPTTKRIEDWSWKPIEEVAQRLDYPTEVPDYIQGGYG